MEYSVPQKQVSSIFKEYRNDIIIYTEDDEKDKNFYLLLINRLLKGTGIRIKDLFPLGSRKEVEEACKKDCNTNKKLYIIDGDVHIQYDKRNNIPNLHILDSYCIENYLICQDAIAEVAHNFGGGIDNKEDIKDKMNISKILNIYAFSINCLFFHFSIMEEYDLPYKLKNINAFMSKKNVFQETLVQKEIEELKNRIIESQVSKIEYQGKIKQRQAKYVESHTNIMLEVVSGKDYLIPIIQNHIKNTLGYKIGLSLEAWKYNLAQHCTLDRLDKVKTAILKAVNAD